MTDDFFDNCLIDMCVSHHGDGGMTAAVGRSVNMQAVQQRLKEVAVIIVIGKVFTVHDIKVALLKMHMRVSQSLCKPPND